MGKRGPKRKYKSAYDLGVAVDRYFKRCLDDDNKFPDLAGMCIYLDISKKTLARYAEGDDEESVKIRDILDRAADKRESWLVRRMVTEPKSANGCMSALKQKDNGGYIDKPVENGERKLIINISGVGGEQAFK